MANSLKSRDDPLKPFYFNVLDSILLQKFEDALRDLVGGVGGGRAGVDTNPNHNGTARLLPVFSFGDEAGGINGETILRTTLHQGENLGTDSVPDAVERGVVDSTKRL